jgi:hypothetical protein
MELPTAPPIPARPRRLSGRLSSLVTPRASLALRLLVLGAMFAGAVYSYVYFISAGKMNGFPDWPTYNTNYDMQAEGYRSGHLRLSLEPAPELLAADDPYSPINSNYWARDLSYYRGHYYLYWGPLPAILLAAVKIVLRIEGVVGDQYVCFASYLLYLLAGMWLIMRMARRLFPSAPFALSVLGILAYAFANPTPYLLATPGVYQTAIVAAQAFLIAGLAFAFEALYPGATRSRLRTGMLLGAGIAWAMAIACRASVGIPVMVLVLITLIALARAPGRGPVRPAALARFGRWVRLGDAAWLVAPIIVGSFGLLLYNKLRFNAWMDFGQRYQLNDPGLRFRWGLAYLWPNLYTYLLRPIVRSCHFPYAKTIWDIGVRSFPKRWVLPAGYMIAEPVAGILPTMCWSWLAPVGWWAGMRALLRARNGQATGFSSDAQDSTRGIIWASLCFATLATVTSVSWIAVFSATMRYIADVSTGLALSGMIGAWWLYDLTRNHRGWRVLVVVVIVVLAVTTAVIGALLGFTGYIEHFRHFNPELMDRLEEKLSLCRR